MKYFDIKIAYTLVVLIAMFGFAGCTAADDEENESQDDHICEHFLYGPEISLTASESQEAALLLLAEDDSHRLQATMHTRYDITLIATDSTYGGYVPYTPVAGEGDYVLFANEALTVDLINTDEAEMVEAEEIWASSEHCELIRSKSVYHLHAEDIYVLHIQSDVETIGMLFPMYTADDDDHDH